MELQCGGRCLKFIVFFFNSIVFVGGAVFSGFGIYLLVEAKASHDAFGVALPAFITTFGLLIFLLGFLGCFGACYENRCMLIMFASIISVLLVAEIVCGVIILVYRSHFVELVGKALKEQITVAEGSSSSSSTNTLKAIDKLQTEFKCCGGIGPSDWKTTPVSCCPGINIVCTKPYSMGCAQAMYNFLQDKLLAVALVLVFICLLQIGAIVCASCLASQLKG